MTTPRATRRWKLSIGLLAWITLCAALSIYGEVYSWEKLLRLWWLVPWAGGLGYYMGRKDQRWEQNQQENHLWLVEDLAEWLGHNQPYELMRFYNRIIFK